MRNEISRILWGVLVASILPLGCQTTKPTQTATAMPANASATAAEKNDANGIVLASYNAPAKKPC